MGKKQEVLTEFESKLKALEKKYGIGKSISEDKVVVSTGSILLDRATGVGGTVLGKMLEISGMESSGKSTIALHQLAEYQKAFPEKKVVLMDFEHSEDKEYMSSIGINLNNILIYQPETMEQGYDMVEELVETGEVSCIVVDSQTAAPPKAVLEGEMQDATIGLQARLNSKFCLKIKGKLDIFNTTLIVISQLRDKIGGYGEQTTTTGGNAFKFYADMRWKIWKTAKKEEGMNVTTIDVIKSKVGIPYGQAKINIVYGKGIDKMGEIIECAVEKGLIGKGGGWYDAEGIKLREKELRTLLEDNAEYYELLKSKITSVKNEVPEMRNQLS